MNPILLYSKENSPLGYDWADKTFSIFASDMEALGYKGLHRAITIQMAKTGNSKVFTLKNANTDAEGDVSSWTYRAEDNSGFGLIVWND